MNDQEISALLELDIQDKCGHIVAMCSRCLIEIRQKEDLELRARCPFCGRFFTRL